MGKVILFVVFGRFYNFGVKFFGSLFQNKTSSKTTRMDPARGAKFNQYKELVRRCCRRSGPMIVPGSVISLQVFILMYNKELVRRCCRRSGPIIVPGSVISLQIFRLMYKKIGSCNCLSVYRFHLMSFV